MSSDFDVSTIDIPAFLMNAPLSLSADVPNNIWMQELDISERAIDRDKAFAQFFELYRAISQFSIVYLLPSTPGLQDQTYVSNLGVVLPHLPQNTVVISKFRATSRVGESAVGCSFFELMGFDVKVPPVRVESPVFEGFGGGDDEDEDDSEIFFEGEADLKYLVDNVYIGAYGLRSSRCAHSWFSNEFGMKVIPFKMNHERQYHLDCCVMPISPQRTAVCTAATDNSTIQEIEKHVEIVDISMEAATHGATNCLVERNQVLFSSSIDEMDKSHRKYRGERAKIAEIENLSSRLGMEPTLFNLSEFDKSGADLSCLIMNLNYKGYLDRVDGAKCQPPR